MTEESKIAMGGFFIGESVTKDSVSGGGMDMRSNEFRKTVLGNEFGRWCRFEGEDVRPAVGCLNMTEGRPGRFRMALDARNGFARRGGMRSGMIEGAALEIAETPQAGAAAAGVGGDSVDGEDTFGDGAGDGGGGGGAEKPNGPSTSLSIVGVGGGGERVAAMTGRTSYARERNGQRRRMRSV